MAAKVGLGLEVDVVGSSLEVSRAKPGQRLFSLDGEWAAEAGGSVSRVPFPGRMGLGRRHPAVGAGGRSCWGAINPLSTQSINLRAAQVPRQGNWNSGAR